MLDDPELAPVVAALHTKWVPLKSSVTPLPSS
jgi:hypothetical protein